MVLTGFNELTQNELYAIDGGLPFVVGVIIAIAIVAVVSVVVACAVVGAGKVAQKVSDWIG